MCWRHNISIAPKEPKNFGLLFFISDRIPLWTHKNRDIQGILTMEMLKPLNSKWKLQLPSKNCWLQSQCLHTSAKLLINLEQFSFTIFRQVLVILTLLEFALRVAWIRLYVLWKCVFRCQSLLPQCFISALIHNTLLRRRQAYEIHCLLPMYARLSSFVTIISAWNENHVHSFSTKWPQF